VKRKFTYKDSKSDKFWEIELDGSSYTTWYGRTGSSPRSDTNTFTSPEEAKKEYERIIREKLKKGYAEDTGAPASAEEKVTSASAAVVSPAFGSFKIRKEFRDYEDEIRSTLKQFIRIELRGNPKNPWNSRLGGVPYMPHGFSFPLNKMHPLLFLAQINFCEVPPLEAFPDKGMLQFYIGDDDLYGLNLENRSNSNFR